MKFRPTLIQLLLIVGIAGVLCAVLLPSGPHHKPHPVKEQEMFGYWISVPEAYSAYRLFLTNGASGLLGVCDIYTNLWSVVSWQVTNRDISIELAPITNPEWPREYIRGKVGFFEIVATHGGVNQDGESWKREMTFYREDALRQSLNAASAVMTNQSQQVNPSVDFKR